MAAIKRQSSLQFDNSFEALSHVMINLQDVYLQLLDDGLNKDAYVELGETLRTVITAISDQVMVDSDDVDDGFDDEVTDD